MEFHEIIWYLVAGLLTGWLASLLVSGRGMGVVRDIAVGMVGALLGGTMSEGIGIPVPNFVSSFTMSLLGSVVFLLVLRFFTRARVKRARAH